MLRELAVQNLALIEDVRVELEPGYCVWTGETGAGKSLLLTALGLLVGGKASADLVREGKSEARIAAIFEVADDALRAEVEAILAGPIEDNQLILNRRITAAGRSVATANGLPVPTSTLRALGDLLLDLHGQHEGRALADPNRQRDLLDAFGALGPRVADYRARRAEHEALRHRRAELLQAADRRRREQALLAFERDELTAAAPRAGEARRLADEAHRLATAGQFREAVAEGYALLYEADRSAQGLLETVARKLGPHAGPAPDVAEAVETLQRLADEVREVAYTLRRLATEWEDDPRRLEEVEARLALYRRLAARFRCEPDDLEARLVEVEAQLAALDRDEADLAALDAPLTVAWNALKSAAETLSAGRRNAATAFANAVQARFKALGLDSARLTVEVTTTPIGDDPTTAAPSDGGADRVEMLFAPNPGEPPRPLRRIASGGELSRVTLAIKTALAAVDRVPTLIFDEIDSGVGGRLGAALGKMLAELAQHHQIICVTHLPQMASHAAHQWAIRKRTERGRTRTTIEKLDDAERVEELAVMLRGASAAEGTRQEARAMLVEARAGN